MPGKPSIRRARARKRRWAAAHRGKKPYSSLERAEFDRGQLERREGSPFSVYECSMGDSPAAVGVLHWHVGGTHYHRSQSEGYDDQAAA